MRRRRRERERQENRGWRAKWLRETGKWSRGRRLEDRQERRCRRRKYTEGPGRLRLAEWNRLTGWREEQSGGLGWESKAGSGLEKGRLLPLSLSPSLPFSLLLCAHATEGYDYLRVPSPATIILDLEVKNFQSHYYMSIFFIFFFYLCCCPTLIHYLT